MPTVHSDDAVLYAFKIEAGRPWYLLLRRAAGTAAAGTWETLAALPRDGELTARAAVRVLMEMTSLDPQSLWALDRVETSFDPGTDRIRMRPVYAALVHGEIVLSRVHDTSRWFSEKEAQNALLCEQQRASLDEVHRIVGTPVGRGQEPSPSLRVV